MHGDLEKSLPLDFRKFEKNLITLVMSESRCQDSKMNREFI